jgi:hypothetical protein
MDGNPGYEWIEELEHRIGSRQKWLPETNRHEAEISTSNSGVVIRLYSSYLQSSKKTALSNSTSST